MSPEPWPTYLVAGCTPWARRVFSRHIQKLPGRWLYVDHPALLETSKFWLTKTPRCAFFLQWRWVVPETVLRKTECIGFQLGDVAQEVAAGKSYTLLTMARLHEMSGFGKVYATHPVRLFGSAEAISTLAMEDAAALIAAFIRAPWAPEAIDAGARFPAWLPKESRLPGGPPTLQLEQVYDRIRLVDAEGYPKAFLDYGGFRYTFRRAVLYAERVEADVQITLLGERTDSSPGYAEGAVIQGEPEEAAENTRR